MIDFEALCAPFPPEIVAWRVGSTTQDKTRGMALAYVDARDVMKRLDEVAGPENWQCRYPHAGQKTVCEIGIRIIRPDPNPALIGEIEWIWKADGAGDTDFEADKGALSDAFKRAAVRWGIGRYLYDLDAPWVTIKPAGKSFAIDASEMPRLRALLRGEKERTSIVQMGEPSAQPVQFTLKNPNGSPGLEYNGIEPFLLALANAIKDDGNYFKSNKVTLERIEEIYGKDKASTGGTIFAWCKKIRNFGGANV